MDLDIKFNRVYTRKTMKNRALIPYYYSTN
jgi:hypothetical protein